ncbi:ATP-binding protein [Candidatus Woesearchaeota archaeon]|nr:ATP-binding protein [Candidatus Woesearchaeota archaeon]
MVRVIIDLVRLIMPLTRQKHMKLTSVKCFVDKNTLKQINYLYRLGKVDIIFRKLGVSRKLFEDKIYPNLILKRKDEASHEFVMEVNEIILKKVKKQAFEDFAAIAYSRIAKLIAPNIYGLEYVKRAVLMQLFSRETVHILLLGDPGTGKTDILKSVEKLFPVSSFGLGSGTSKAGLGVMVKGDTIVEGLLPKANNGICCIDELNLMKKTEYAYLYSAMEKGYIAYDKASKHIKLDAKVRIIATANPKGDKFVGRTVEVLKQQLPFEQALISRFHLIFLIRKPGVNGFLNIAKKIVRGKEEEHSQGDVAFIHDYIKNAEQEEVDFPLELEQKVLDYVENLKKNEDKFLFDLTPRLVVGIIRLCKARARLELRKQVNESDLTEVQTVVDASLFLKK